MKLQNMTVIFSIIVIPITLILSAYIGIQIDTAMLWQQYDTKLIDATHDAVAAFELNTINNKYSTNADSIRRDIKAAINTFSTSLATGFGMSGSNATAIMPYIPALVFTLYDGYYIYSPHEYNYEYDGQLKTGYEHVLQPYTHYTGRYKNESNDITVNYSLDNYVTIYGYIGSEYISYSGYLIDMSKLVVNNGTVVGYKLSEGDNLVTGTKEIIKYNDIDTNNKIVEKQIETDSMQKYYQEAYEFTKWITTKQSLITTVTPKNAIRSDGTKFDEFAGDNSYLLSISSSNDPEDRASAFVQHKREIMKISIQDNLNKAITVYNENSPSMGTHANFQMPILTDVDWEKILTNVNLISFMEGVPVGTKVYNNYTIVTSTQNKQYINPNSIYFVDNSDTYHRINCPVLEQNVKNGSSITGYKSLDFRRHQNPNDNTKYYYKHSEYACYTCIVNSLNQDIEIQKIESPQLLKSYYSALARERYDLNKVTEMLNFSKTKN